MKERAVLWATEKSTKKLFFVVVEMIIQRNNKEELFSLIPCYMEVLGPPTKPEDALSSLLENMATWP